MFKLIGQLFKFGVVGVLCFLIDYGIMIALTELLYVTYLVSCGISFIVSVIVNYLLSMRFVFQSGEKHRKVVEFAAFVILSVIGLVLTEALMMVFTGWLGIHYMLSKIIVTAIVMIYNFISRKMFLEGLVSQNQNRKVF